VGFVADIGCIAASMVPLLSGAIRAAQARKGGGSSQLLQVAVPVVVPIGSVCVTCALLLFGGLHTDVWAVWLG
jgi:hypothetical protein